MALGLTVELQNVYMQYFLSLQHAYQFEMLPQLLVVIIGELEPWYLKVKHSFEKKI